MAKHGDRYSGGPEDMQGPGGPYRHTSGNGPGFGQRHQGYGPGYGRGMGWGHGWRARMEGQFRSKGYRFTVPRQIILEILEQNEDYVNAENLYLQVHDMHPGIGLATVYRTLQLLVEIGVVSRIETGDGKARFKLAGENEKQRREVLICTNCFRTFPIQTISEVQQGLIEKIEKRLQEDKGFEVRQSVLQFYGICDDCARRVQKHPGENNI
jgi:Fur family transcriptional regulator, ferric uptake regulator